MKLSNFVGGFADWDVIDFALQRLALAKGRKRGDVPSLPIEVVRLTSGSPIEERLRVYRLIRESGDVSDDVALYLICMTVVYSIFCEAAATTQEIHKQFEGSLRDGGLEELANISAVALKAAAYRQACPSDFRARFCAKLQEVGENELATLLLEDEAAFWARCGSGYQTLMESDAPEPMQPWLMELSTKASEYLCGSGNKWPVSMTSDTAEGVTHICINVLLNEAYWDTRDDDESGLMAHVNVWKVGELFDYVGEIQCGITCVSNDICVEARVDGLYSGHHVALYFQFCHPLGAQRCSRKCCLASTGKA
jgi:hypothetical protein